MLAVNITATIPNLVSTRSLTALPSSCESHGDKESGREAVLQSYSRPEEEASSLLLEISVRGIYVSLTSRTNTAWPVGERVREMHSQPDSLP